MFVVILIEIVLIFFIKLITKIIFIRIVGDVKIIASFDTYRTFR